MCVTVADQVAAGALGHDVMVDNLEHHEHRHRGAGKDGEEALRHGEDSTAAPGSGHGGR